MSKHAMLPAVVAVLAFGGPGPARAIQDPVALEGLGKLASGEGDFDGAPRSARPAVCAIGGEVKDRTAPPARPRGFLQHAGESAVSLVREPARIAADSARHGWKTGSSMRLPFPLSAAEPLVQPVTGALGAAVGGSVGLAVGVGRGLWGFLKHAALAVGSIFGL